MNLDVIENRFGVFLEKCWQLSDIAPFLLVYIQLLLLFKSELSPVEFDAVLERQKQLRGEKFSDNGFDELRSLSRKEMDRDVRDTSTTRRSRLNRLLFCALLDEEENDFFYLTEPVFEFVRGMGVPPVQLTRILESEFAGLKI